MNVSYYSKKPVLGVLVALAIATPGVRRSPDP